jgi:hypothetical protein
MAISGSLTQPIRNAVPHFCTKILVGKSCQEVENESSLSWVCQISTPIHFRLQIYSQRAYIFRYTF